MDKLLKSVFIFRIPRNLRIIYFTLAVSEFAVGVAKPVVPFLIFAVNSTLLPSTYTHAQRAVYYAIFISLHKVGASLSNPVFGVLSDILGRKAIFITSIVAMIIVAVTSILGVMTQNIMLFLAGSFLFGFLWSERTVCTAAINDMSSSSEKVVNLSKMQFFIGIGVCFGPIAGGFIGQGTVMGHPYIMPYVVLFVLSMLLMFYITLFFKETYIKERKNFVLETIAKQKKLKFLFKDKRLYILMVIYLLSQISWGAYHEYIPVVVKLVFKYDIYHVGILMGLIGVALIMASGFLLPVLYRYFCSLSLIKFSCYLSTAGVILCYLFSYFPNWIFSDIVIWITVFPVVAGDVMIFVILLGLFSELAGKKFQGTIAGLLYITGSFMWVISALLGGILMHWHANASLLICPVTMLFLLIYISVYSGKIKDLVIKINPEYTK